MDRVIYVAMSGAKQMLGQQSTVANNLANASTTGYRAQLTAFRAAEVFGDGTATRAFVVDSTPAADFRPGTIQHTGRDLDVAIEGTGWIAVQTADGTEAYTRNGSLQVNVNGVLQTRNGLTIMGDGGPIAIPADSRMTVAADGTVSTVPNGNQAAQVTPIGRIKLVNPPEAELVRGDDGLFRVRSGVPAEVDTKVKLQGGALEGSNVNVVEAMVSMISISRQFDMHMKVLQNAEGNERQASQLLSMNR
ncbi:MAG TPA: flagellar basal-body rod protein FlgF [Burkholderiales bacterium]|nr:flagellar basal-body rod protein FlgF [Burkholderiales bacterium]